MVAVAIANLPSLAALASTRTPPRARLNPYVPSPPLTHLSRTSPIGGGDSAAQQPTSIKRRTWREWVGGALILIDFGLMLVDFGLIFVDFDLILIDVGLILIDFGLILLDFSLILIDFGLIFVDFGLI